MKEILHFNGKEVELECNAFTPIKFKQDTGKELLAEAQKLGKKSKEDVDLEFLINLVFVMIQQAGYEDTLEVFLSSIDLSELYEFVIPAATELWKKSSATSSKQKKDPAK